jgi:hypothetical protein
MIDSVQYGFDVMVDDAGILYSLSRFQPCTTIQRQPKWEDEQAITTDRAPAV